MIELNLENELVGIVANATRDLSLPVGIIGAWNPAPRGTVKTTDAAKNAAINCLVRVAPRSFAGYGVTTPIFQCEIVTRLRSDLDPSSSSFAAFVGAVTDAFSRLNADVDIDRALNVGGLYVTAFNLQGGTSPSYDETTKCWFVTQQVQIIGVFAGN